MFPFENKSSSSLQTVFSSPFQKEYHIGDTHFFVYRVKHSFEEEFENKSLFEILLSARKSYLRYGQVPLMDLYDQKSSIYLCQTIFPFQKGSLSCVLEEWSSVRFVPLSGTPELSQDMKICLLNGTSVFQEFAKHFFSSEEEAKEKTVTVSRICKIPAKVFSDHFYTSHEFLPEKSRHIAFSVFLMFQLFLEESKKNQKKYEWFTAVAQEALFEKVLSLHSSFPSVRFPFFKASDVLKQSSPCQRMIDRNAFSYMFPRYFLDMNELCIFLKKLLGREQFSFSLFEKKCGISTPILTALEHFESIPEMEKRKLSGVISEMFGVDGFIFDGPLHSSEFRSRVDLLVSDAIELFLSPVSEFEKQYI